MGLSGRKSLDGMFLVLRVVWGPPMLTEFQLWVLSTIVMLAVVIVSAKLPG